MHRVAHQVEPSTALGEGIMLQRGRPVVSVHHVAGLLPELGDPGSELSGV